MIWRIAIAILLLASPGWAADVRPSLTGVTISTIGTTKIADNFPGANIGAKIVNAIASLPADGGTVLVYGIADKTISGNPLASVTKPVTLHFDCGTWTLNSTAGVSSLALSSAHRVLGAGECTVFSGNTFTSGANGHGFIEILAGATGSELGHFRLVAANGAAAPQMKGGILVKGATRPHVHDIFLDHVYVTGGLLYVEDSSYGNFHDIKCETWAFPSDGGHCIRDVRTVAGNSHNLYVNNSALRGAFGWSCDSSGRNVVVGFVARGDNATTYSDTLEGLNITSCPDTVVSGVSTIGRGDGGIVTVTSNNTTYDGIVTAYNKFQGLYIDGDRNTASSVTAYNNGQSFPAFSSNEFGVEVVSGDDNVLGVINSFDTQGGSATQRYGLGVTNFTNRTRIGILRAHGNNTAPYIDNGTGTKFAGWDFDTTGNLVLAGGVDIKGPASFTLGSDANGDMWYRASGVITRLAAAAAGQVLTSGTTPAWSATPSITSLTTTSGATCQFGGSATCGVFINANDAAVRAPGGTTQDVYIQSDSGTVTYARFTNEGGTSGATIGNANAPPSGVALHVVGVTNTTTGYRVNNTATSGTILRCDGTNCGLSTATYPNTVTTGDVLAATGTNVVGVAARGQLPATATNDSASAGNLGEIAVSEVLSGSAVSLTTATDANVTSVSLTAGDWDVDGNICLTTNAATAATAFTGWVSTTSATIPTAPNLGSYTQFVAASVANNFNGMCWPIGTRRVSLSGTTTTYLSTRVAFTLNTASAYGYLRARRVR